MRRVNGGIVTFRMGSGILVFLFFQHGVLENFAIIPFLASFLIDSDTYIY